MILRPFILVYSFLFFLNVGTGSLGGGAGLGLGVNAQGVKSTITSFKNPPARLFFFDDTESAIFHDSMEGTVYVSQDEGKSWKQADDIPSREVLTVVEHPWNNRYAFALTGGTTHYRTEDRGKSWRKFTMPVPMSITPFPLSFHYKDNKFGYILYQGTKCTGRGWSQVCHDETYITKDAFADEPQLLLSDSLKCTFAHSSKDFKHEAHDDLIYCVAFDSSSSTGSHSLANSRLFSSTDFFKSDRKVEELGIGKNAKGVIAFAVVSKYAVVALKDLESREGEMMLYVTTDTKNWAKAQFPHASSARLRENAYTLLESTTYSMAVDVMLQDQSAIGTLFTSNSNGTYFVESLKDTNRNMYGFVDFEKVYGVDGVGIANVVGNAKDVEAHRAEKQIRSVITFDDGSNWLPIRAPAHDSDGKRIHCDPSDTSECSLHFHSVTNPHNYGRIFSSPAPGFVMGVGSIGATLAPYEECDTFLSTDAGVSWEMVRRDAHKYEFGDQGSVLVVVNDEEGVDKVRYSLNLGKDWKSHDIGVKLRARALITLPDSTSQKFLLVGLVSKKDRTKDLGPIVIVYLDFSSTRTRKCEEKDFEKWYARHAGSGGGGSGGRECLMGHKQWYKRRKVDADCYVGERYVDPVEHEEDCECGDLDYECDYNYVRHNNECIPVGPEPIPANVCLEVSDHYMGSSGYRKIPGNTCKGGIEKDKKVQKSCKEAAPQEGEVVHQTFKFDHQIAQHAYFKESKTILVRLVDHSIWQSSNEGYSWKQLFPEARFLGFYHHKYSVDRAYLITDKAEYYFTTDTGRTWNKLSTPTTPNSFGAQALRFHPWSDNLIWTGNKDCHPGSTTCHAEAHYTRDNGRNWNFVESYVRNCAWAKDKELDADPNEILCESFKEKGGDQRMFDESENPMELVVGGNFFEKGRKRKMFDQVVGFAKFSEFLVVASSPNAGRSLELQVSLDGSRFATGQFPPGLSPETHAYTVLESSTKSLFMHMTTSEPPQAPYWGTILKSNSNGTYFGLSIDNVNRDERGYVDFEKMIGLDGIALINVVSNPDEAAVTGRKTLQSRITHNDGSMWKTLNPPSVDSLGNKYKCEGVKCALHVHGYTERLDPRATYSSPSIVGVLMAVGNVGEHLLPYKECDTFLSRDGGFTWEEVHKDAHLWEFGDSGSILIMANDEEPTDHVLFSTDEGKTWREYKFGEEKIRVRYLVTVPSDTSRRFILFGNHQRDAGTVAVHIDFSALTNQKCVYNPDDPGHDDFELWSPSEERAERCLFGRQTLYHRRIREANCVVGEMPKVEEKIVSNCPCAKVDFECEYNHVRDENDECVLVPGTTPRPDDEYEQCKNGEEYWYSRTAYRLIPYSSCEGGERFHQGTKHRCPGFGGRGVLFWIFILLLPFGFTALVAYWFYRRSGLARGTIRLPGDARPSFNDSGILGTLASVPWFLIGVAGIAWEWVLGKFDSMGYRSRRGYRDLPVDEDAQVLRFEDEE